MKEYGYKMESQRRSRIAKYNRIEANKKIPRYVTLNVYAVVAHAIAALAMAILYAYRKNLLAPLTETYLRWVRLNGEVYQNVNMTNQTACDIIDPPGRFLKTATGDFCIIPTTGAVGCDENGKNCFPGLDLGWLVISFHLLSFTFQLFAACTEYCKEGVCGYKYSTMVANGKNPLRFIEYSISASIMLICIALLNGVTDMLLLISITVLTTACQLLGLVVEYLENEQKSLKLILHFTGWFLFFCAYGIIIHAFLKSVFAVPNVNPPDFVYVIVIGLFLLYSSFGIVQLVEVIRDLQGAPCAGDAKEVAYVVLSFTAKLFLGILIFTNVLLAS